MILDDATKLNDVVESRNYAPYDEIEKVLKEAIDEQNPGGWKKESKFIIPDQIIDTADYWLGVLKKTSRQLRRGR